jgi:hypothetical protein
MNTTVRTRNLSSSWTFVWKFIYPIVWIPFFGLVSVHVGLDVLPNGNRAPPSPEEKLAVLAMWFFGALTLLRVNARLKRVRIDDRHLIVSNYFREIRVPFEGIADVRQSRWLWPRPVTVYFRDTTEFGNRASFTPKRNLLLGYWWTDPVVDELKRLAGLGPKA